MTDSVQQRETDSDTIREAVRQRYGDAAKRQLEIAGDLPTLGARISDDDVVAVLVDESANACAADDASCCAPGDTAEDQFNAVKAFYDASDTSALPPSVTDAALGCGNPTAIAELAPGETVLDLGSGGGIDCFLAAKQVGETGSVIGIDMTDEMLDLARRNAGRLGATNVDFRKGQIEALPVEDGSVDVIISNCVVNLSTDKPQVLREAFRVLKPGGRFRISDLVLTRDLTIDEEKYLAEWTGCIAGALRKDEFSAQLAAAGFEDVQLDLKSEWRDAVYSANITARKPG